MSFKYKFGTPEVISMISGILFLSAIALLLRYLNAPYTLEIAAVVIVAISALFGPTAGGVTAVASTLVFMLLMHLDIGYLIMFGFVLMSIGVGHYAADFGIRDGAFNRDRAFLFLAVHLLVEGFMWVFFVPFFTFLVYRTDLFIILRQNIDSLVLTVLMNVILLPVFFAISASVKKWQERRKRATLVRN